MSLRDRLRARIEAEGPISVSAFMQACLHDPQYGYYASRPALGEHGDFITAPLVSQMFGELIGLWAVEIWESLGKPSPFYLVEAGPGDGTLFSDLMRAARLSPDFLDAARPWLVETSAPLRAIQQERLTGMGVEWATSLDAVPSGAPLILVANELLDCLGADQFIRTDQGWAERRVGLDDAGELTFGLTPAVPDWPPAPLGAVLEVSPAQAGFGAALAERLVQDGGAALLIDYGRDQPGLGDTLQALKGHAKVDVLATAGEADLTVHADFPAVAQAGRSAGAGVSPIVSQGRFLRRLGIEARAQALAARWPDKAEVVGRQLHRLIAPDQMGDLFKVLCLYHPTGLVIPGLEEGAP
ncbi:MAG: SAM-dependent methyltransferase [Caulobacteraceae bacterium]|nr:SAM-dependent methyltransferase [Caulobacteraceae bacterium]